MTAQQQHEHDVQALEIMYMLRDAGWEFVSFRPFRFYS